MRIPQHEISVYVILGISIVNIKAIWIESAYSSSLASKRCCIKASTFVLDTKSVFCSQFLGVSPLSCEEADWLRADLLEDFADEADDAELETGA